MASGEKSKATRDRVLAVSADLFQQNGYLSTSMRDIASAAGMKSGSLYYYFESKEALLAAILNENIDETLAKLRAAVAALPAGASVRSRFRAAAKANMSVILAAGDMAIASQRTLGLLRAHDYEEQIRHRVSYNQFWRQLLVEGKKSGEIKASTPEAFALMFVIGAMSFVPEWFDPARSTSDEAAEAFASLFFDGIALSKRRRPGPEVPASR